MSPGRKLDDYLTVKQAAALLGVSPDTLRNWDRAGKLVAQWHPLNGYRLYCREQLTGVLSSVTTPMELPSAGVLYGEATHSPEP